VNTDLQAGDELLENRHFSLGERIWRRTQPYANSPPQQIPANRGKYRECGVSVPQPMGGKSALESRLAGISSFSWPIRTGIEQGMSRECKFAVMKFEAKCPNAECSGPTAMAVVDRKSDGRLPIEHEK
jgi:hypothetical protein